MEDPGGALLGALTGSEAVRAHGLSLWLFLRCLGAVYLIAFVSLWSQLDGLFGSRGILPIRDYLEGIADRKGGPDLRRVPSLFWLDASDAALHGACALGTLLSSLVIAGVASGPALLLLWGLYLSFASTGQAFLSYQWDVLLLEAGFLGALLAPWGVLPGAAGAPPDPALFLLWWLLFRLILQSGLGKLTSGDESWRDLTALRYHWFTQPLPTPLAWYAARLPEPAHRLATAATHVVELGVPLLIFGPPEARVVAAALIAGHQLLIMATGNYNFFNLLTVSLCVLLVPDAAWTSLLPGGALDLLGEIGAPVAGGADALAVEGGDRAAGGSRIGITLSLAVVWLVGGGGHLWRTLSPDRGIPAPLARLLRGIQPYRTVNSYGLFRVMTRQRPEIVIEGSRDGERWRPYEFRWKPGDPGRAPGWVQPHQPRLDWQMWFAALGSYRATPWFRRFQARLLEGASPVLDLLEEAPFPADDPPRYLRARTFRYRFTDAREREQTGRWWKREEMGTYGPPLKRREE